MRKALTRGVKAVLAITLVGALVLATYSQTAGFGPDGNGVKNSGFEEWSGVVPTGWSLDQKVAGKGMVSQTGSPLHAGRYSLRLTPNRNNTARDLGGDPFGLGQVFSLDLVRGKRVYISAWLGAEGGATAATGVFAVTRQGQVIAAEIKEPSGGATGLSRQESFVDIPNNSNISFVVFLCMVYGTSGSAYFDDLHIGLQQVRASALGPGVTPSAGAKVVVDASKTIRTIPAELHGTNLEWIWDGNGAWEPGRNRLNEVVVTQTRDLGPSLLRFPGGTFSDFYHWRDGIGSQQSRKETDAMPGGPRTRHTFGTDEALMFAERVNGQLLITVNAGTGTPQEAADWVRYVNKDRRKVVYWEIGNELYMNDGSSAAKASTLPPDRYARRVLDFAMAMRAVDPGIKIGAIVEESLNASQPKGYRDWTEQVLRIAGRQIDFVAVHNAYAPGLSDDKGWSTRTVYGAMLAAPIYVRQSLERLSAKIDSLVPGSNIKIAVTEFGPYFQLTPDGRFVDHVKTLGSALYVGSVMQEFMRTPRVEIANAFKLIDPLFMGWIGKRGDQFVPTAPYYASQMYTRHFGKRLVQASAEGPTFTAEAVGLVDRMHQVPYLDVVASRSDDGRKLYVLVVNKHFDQSIKAALDIRGFRPSSGTAWVLNGESIDSNTGTAPTNVGRVRWARQAVDEVGRQFDNGAPGKVGIRRVPLSAVQSKFEYEFPSHSIVSLEFSGQ
jgi:alpha-N-arabinofuranosidase